MSNIIRVLNFTSYKEDCGIAKYQEQFIQGMEGEKDIKHTVFSVSPYKLRRMKPEVKKQTINDLLDDLKSSDILHIQHEFGFFAGEELGLMVNGAKKLGKKVVITMHTSPTYAYKLVERKGISLRAVYHYVRESSAKREFMRTRFEPVKQADMIIVHNKATKKDLEKYGVALDKIKIIRHPVPLVSDARTSTELSDNLHRTEGDIIIASIGFPSMNKGAIDTIRALTFLPKNYKLAIVGGVHPSGENEGLIDEICSLAYYLEVSDRLYITGLVKDDDEFNAIIRDADICVFPYVKKYYDHVSSGALNSGIANHKPVVAYPTQSFIEMNEDGVNVVQLTKSFNYYELARSLKNLDYVAAKKATDIYLKQYAWPKEASRFAGIYRQIISR